MDIDQGLLLKIKNHIRISHAKLDDDVLDTIAIALADLHVVGVQAPPAEDPQELDPLILSAVRLYCKAEYSEDATEAEKYMGRYEKLKACLMMAGDYRGEAAADE